LPADEQTPDWIVQAQTEPPSDEQDLSMSVQETPDWLKELSSEETQTEEATQPVDTAGVTKILSDEELPEMESDQTAEAPSSLVETSSVAGENLAEMDLDSAMAWMEALAAKQGADEESLKITPPEARTEIAPEWIQQQAESAAETPAAAPAEEISAVTEAPAAEPVEMAEAVTPAEFEPQATIEPEPVTQDQLTAEPDLNDLDSAMAWMEALAAKQGADEESLKITPPEMRSEVAPDWIQQHAQESLQQPEAGAVPTEPIAEELAPEPEKGDVTGPVSEESQLPAFAVETLELAPEALGELPQAEEYAPEEPETTPDWITELIEEKIPDEEAVAASLPTDMQAPIEPVAEMPEALVEPAADETISTPQAEAAPETPEEAEIPEWLRSYEEEQRQEHAWLPDETLTTEAITDDQLPDWLRAEAETTVSDQTGATTQILGSVEETAGIAPEAEMPGWLQDMQGVTAEPEAIAAEQPAESTGVPEYQPETPAASEAAPHGDRLALARASLPAGDLDQAAVAYNDCINANQDLNDVIEDLKSALDQHPVDVTLWQTLGDAYMRTDRIQDALDAYTKAEELLR
ncbi:MAG TPA: BTAD domain-containing putative transcriptional regulator, partial [Anaerolinea sp.]|nr:BTAD domain-containing putative transcriptional regulator [Anaerolinea sp.]